MVKRFRDLKEIRDEDYAFDVDHMFFASLDEALTHYLAFEEGEGTFCISLPNIGNVCLF